MARGGEPKAVVRDPMVNNGSSCRGCAGTRGPLMAVAAEGPPRMLSGTPGSRRRSRRMSHASGPSAKGACDGHAGRGLQHGAQPVLLHAAGALERSARSRSLRADVPLDDVETNRAKAARIRGLTALGQLAAAAPDVLVVFGDDQLECFDFTNFPAFAVYVGETFEGALAGGVGAKVWGHPALGMALLSGLMQPRLRPRLVPGDPETRARHRARLAPAGRNR